MTEITAYNNPAAPTHRQWIAYVVLDDGKLWGVYATSNEEQTAKARIEQLWIKERGNTAADPWASVPTTTIELKSSLNGPFRQDYLKAKEHHFAGKVWMRHKEKGLVRIAANDVVNYEQQGYYKSGPRGK